MAILQCDTIPGFYRAQRSWMTESCTHETILETELLGDNYSQVTYKTVMVPERAQLWIQIIVRYHIHYTHGCLFVTPVSIRSLQSRYKSRRILHTHKQHLGLSDSWNSWWNTWKQKRNKSRLSGSSCWLVGKDLAQGPACTRQLRPCLLPEMERWR